jgi:uncharacterized protein (DUF362 family)
MSCDKPFVVISNAPECNYRQDYVTLPRNYGSEAYFAREDVRLIQSLVNQNLNTLDDRIQFTQRLTGKRVIIKPNLVTVYSRMGLVEENYPETTDPRVLDAVVAFFQQFTCDIVIVESSGRGVPTRGSFRVVGIDRLARYRGVELQALEEQPTMRYLLPKAKIQKEIIIPKIFSEVISGSAFYVSLPKLKTNMYTGVTLGFKNAMGILPYNLRQRNHNHSLDQKLVDMLYLFQPDLVIIDGLVGGEGNCPAPVDPVDSRVIISGNNSVETDRVATRLMGFDPDSIELMRLADAADFGDPRVEVIGDQTVIPFRPADPTLNSDIFCANFPNVHVFDDYDTSSSLHADNEGNINGNSACRGGCLATTRFAFEMFIREGKRLDFSLNLFLGPGKKVNGQVFYQDKNGRSYSLDDIAKLRGKKMAVGSCTRHLAGIVDKHVDGCMPYPNAPHVALHQLTGTWCSVLSLRNRYLIPLLFDTLKMCESRKRLYRFGIRLDCLRSFNAEIIEPRTLTAEELLQDYIIYDMAPLNKDEIRTLCASENRAVLATFLG